ncbi:nucleotidyl transferase AbiEii/AbiGii toxin family protein [Sphingomonas sp. CCH5-D11]|jgi:hypothetical protein|uniref:nucleotidyl transferase AbiEii/AbiGii toxin family protein n=1 Tax=Sphingomonas sp. CCH5-D11 TaxID=1768786 RepID=UPI000832B6CB|nr:nucleotidyl transferase AbiEii/AbiGii toxin family protein [Sphingomonas sp. CCH5-D11]
MNAAFDDVLGADAETRAGLFGTTALRMGTTSQNVEKDFWVCWTLDALFNGLPSDRPRLLFKGGTSLSKGFGLIERFSEDIDVTVFRDDLGESVGIAELGKLSGKKRRARLDSIRAACQGYVTGSLRDELTDLLRSRLTAAGGDPDTARVDVDEDDPDGQTLLLWYPAATQVSEYIRAAVKIESGAKSALDPNSLRTVKPYVDDDVPGLDFAVPNVTVVDAERTFWDKVVILHGLRRWFDRRGELRGGGQRVSRHYYDVHRLMDAPLAVAAIKDVRLGADCVAHARMFFDRPDFDLASAEPGRFALEPHDGMVEALRRDYGAMQGMIFGEPPAFDDVLRSIAGLEGQLNAEGVS